jgi:hypothetical protein
MRRGRDRLNKFLVTSFAKKGFGGSLGPHSWTAANDACLDLTPASFEYMYHPQHDIQTRGIDASNDTPSQQQQREYPTFWKRIQRLFRDFFTK